MTPDVAAHASVTEVVYVSVGWVEIWNANTFDYDYADSEGDKCDENDHWGQGVLNLAWDLKEAYAEG